ncbi:PTS sugar transporter subunit IIA [Niallia sp. Krafla_26]|uniref:PTS sugar transporter subunit IIA n=1 Tax=Niallia sp. Krafla_26 TaxID=3064703 RepID=UPI003D176DE5
MKTVFHLGLKATHYQEVIETLGNQLNEAGYVKDSYVDAVLERESVLPTGLKTGSLNVAIPHTDMQHVNETVMAVATLDQPVKFNLMEDPSQEADVDIVFLLGVTKPKEQTELLSALMSIFKDKERLEKIKEAKTESDCERILNLVMA